MTITIPVEALRARLDNGRLLLKHSDDPHNPQGPTTFYGALHQCETVPGDAVLLRVLDLVDEKDWAEVELFLFDDPEIPDELLSEQFGPQWEHIVALVRQAAAMTTHQMNQLVDAWRHCPWIPNWGPAIFATERAAKSTGSTFIWGNAAYAAMTAAEDSVRAAALQEVSKEVVAAVAATAHALAVRDLIGTSELTQSHYDLLTLPWAVAIGPVHPDDSAPAEM